MALLNCYNLRNIKLGNVTNKFIVNMSSAIASHELYFCELSVEWLHAQPSIHILLMSKEPVENRMA